MNPHPLSPPKTLLCRSSSRLLARTRRLRLVMRRLRRRQVHDREVEHVLFRSATEAGKALAGGPDHVLTVPDPPRWHLACLRSGGKEKTTHMLQRVHHVLQRVQHEPLDSFRAPLPPCLTARWPLAPLASARAEGLGVEVSAGEEGEEGAVVGRVGGVAVPGREAAAGADDEGGVWILVGLHMEEMIG